MKFDATSYAKNMIINMSSSAGLFASDYTMNQHLEFLDGFKLELGGIKQNGGSIDIDLKHDKISFKKVYIDVFGLHFLWSSKEEPWFIYHLCRTTNNEYYLSLLGRKKKNNIS